MLKIAEQRLTKNIISFFDKSSMSTRIENWSKIDGERSVSALFAINKERKMRRPYRWDKFRIGYTLLSSNKINHRN